MKIGELQTNENDDQNIELYFWNTALFMIGLTAIFYLIIFVIAFILGMFLEFALLY